MSRHVRYLVFITCCLLTSLSAGAKADTFIFSSIDEVQKIPNLISIVETAYHSLGHDIKIKFLPGKRALLEAEHNKNYDGEFVRIREAEAILEHLIRVPVPIIEAKAVALSKSPNITLKTPSDLRNHRLAAIRGVIFTDNLLKDYTTTYVGKLQQGISMLELSRIELFVIPDLVARQVVENISNTPLVWHDLPVETVKLYHYVNQRHATILPDLTAALAQASGNAIEAK